MSATRGQPASQSVSVRHHFDGDLRLQNSTFDRRMKIRSLLVALHEEVTHLIHTDEHATLTADINITVTGRDAQNHHTYHVSVGDFFPADGPSTHSAPNGTAQEHGTPATTTASHAISAALDTPTPCQDPNLSHPHAPQTSRRNGSLATVAGSSQHASPTQHGSASPERARKRMRSEAGLDDQDELGVVSTPHMLESHAVHRSHEVSPRLAAPMATTRRLDLRPLHKTLRRGAAQEGLDGEKLDSLQNTLGASLNFQNSQTMQELGNISKLLPWLESCRKTAADVSTAREEKWRTSSATFHDQTRKERERAEKQIMDELKAQKEVLGKQQRMIAQLLKNQGEPTPDDGL
ncbi:hypothetical protein H2203_007480 [Taxawa tesnikishii (nom. ined.)]|nr:hypothetical protein H2203_007480 [Dothideales sp. JES 119]